MLLPPFDPGRRDFVRRLSGWLAALALGDHTPRLLRAAAGAPDSRARPVLPPEAGAVRGLVDRRARVARHNPLVRSFDPLAPLSVGNGRFAFTADATGLQTFPGDYRPIPLATEAEWGWHSFPNPEGYRLEDALAMYEAHGRPVPYASAQDTPAGQWLRQNPHRLSLARLGFVLRDPHGLELTVPGASGAGDLPAPATGAISDIRQRLDLWSGTLDSGFRLDGRIVRVLTRVHPQRDVVAVRVDLAGLEPGMVGVRIAFPYGSPVHTGDPADWSDAKRHVTQLLTSDRAGAAWRCTLDGDGYRVRAGWSPGARLEREGEHVFRLEPAPGSAALELVAEFVPDGAAADPLPSFDEVGRACADHWQHFWTDGAVVDLGGSRDARAPELERRIVLSEYLTAIQCAGTLPPQETGETFNSWHGKFHLEMHWWHAAHFALWDRAALLERSLPWYGRILPRARETARRQGYRGARWPKMVGPDGRESPSTIGPFLVWQQPHPIYLAELVYRARPARAVLERYRELVHETAEFMASYPAREETTTGGRYVLGPPLIPAQEIHPPQRTFNPTFELAYWDFGLGLAQRWRRRLGLAPEPVWDRVRRGLARLPVRDGLYVAAESAPDTFRDRSQQRDHPSMLGAYGFLPSARVDRPTMRRTLRRVLEHWQWEQTWGWDFPLAAMAAARLGERALAMDALLMDTPHNRWLPNGHNYQRPGLTIYLPGNGGLLAAVAMMAGGWDGGPVAPAPGFPDGWSVRAERLRPMV